MPAHAIRQTHDDGKPLKRPVYWCGRKRPYPQFEFTDAQHMLNAVRQGTGIRPCRACLRAMKRVIDHELSGGVIGDLSDGPQCAGKDSD